MADQPDLELEMEQPFEGPMMPADALSLMVRDGTVYIVLLVPVKEDMKQSGIFEMVPPALRDKMPERFGVPFPLDLMIQGLNTVDEEGWMEEIYKRAQQQGQGS